MIVLLFTVVQTVLEIVHTADRLRDKQPVSCTATTTAAGELGRTLTLPPPGSLGAPDTIAATAALPKIPSGFPKNY
jgi:hypothetical protein